MSPWIDRQTLVNNAKTFVSSHGLFLRRYGPRISSLVEISVYNSIVQYYQSLGFHISGQNLGPKKSFKYKLTATGLAENHSYFIAKKDALTFHILHNIRIQSAHHDHLYFTADVVVTSEVGATTQKLRNGRRHSFVANPNLVTFAEVKHLTPFPEVLFSYVGLVLEFMPGFVHQKYTIALSGDKPCPIIAFTGPPSPHVQLIQEDLTKRYGINIVFGTSATFGQLRGFAAMRKYTKPEKEPAVSAARRPTRRFNLE